MPPVIVVTSMSTTVFALSALVLVLCGALLMVSRAKRVFKTTKSRPKASNGHSAHATGHHSGAEKVHDDDGTDQHGSSGDCCDNCCGNCCSDCYGLCWLLCCPPCPSVVVAKAAFHPPCPSTYCLIKSDGGQVGMVLSARAKWRHSPQEMASLQVCRIDTARGSCITCLFVRGTHHPKYTVLFSHGNATDLGEMASWYYQLSRHVNVNVLAYDYSGYGCSTGTPTEANMYADIDAAFQLLSRPPLNIAPNRTILYGQSIGSAPTIDLAARRPDIAGVVIQSGFTSGMRLMLGPQKRPSFCTRFCDAFVNIDKVERIESPVLVIHGTADQMIDPEHGLQLYRACPKTVDACWIQNAGHNDVLALPELYNRMNRFLIELDKHQMKQLKQDR